LSQEHKGFLVLFFKKELLLSVLLTSPCLATDLTAAQKAAIDLAATQTLNAAGVPGASLAVVKDGKIVYAHAYGFAVLPTLRTTRDMAFPLGSVSKQFTASTILLLAQDGKLSLDDKVGRFLPALSHADNASIRQVLSHTAGYEDYAPEDFTTPAMTKPITPQDILAKWGAKPLDFRPGTQWQYSNTGYTIAGLIAEAAGGASLFAQMQARIFVPLHMSSAADYDAHGVPAGGPAGYQRYALGPPRLAERDRPGWSYGSGGLAMTASDLARWDISLMDRSLLSAASYAALETPIKLTDGRDTGYGLGVELRVVAGHHGIVHTARQIEAIVFGIPPGAPADPAQAQLLGMLADLARGHIDMSRLNANAQFYFSPAVLADFHDSLAPLGPVISLHERAHEGRGGMVFHSYDVAYLTKRLVVTTYELPDGKLGQLLIQP
jgi:D-alanyl-D-alanine carboxypeptidase